MSYRKELKTERKIKLAQMGRILGDGKSLSTAERKLWDDLKLDIDSIDARISGLTGVPDYRGGDSRHKARKAQRAEQGI